MWNALLKLIESLQGTPADGIITIAGITVVMVMLMVFRYLLGTIEKLRGEVVRLNENATADCRKETKELAARIEKNAGDFWGRYNGGSDKFRAEIKDINDRLLPVEKDCYLYSLTIKPKITRVFEKKDSSA